MKAPEVDTQRWFGAEDIPQIARFFVADENRTSGGSSSG
jgi:hypothetical protein